MTYRRVQRGKLAWEGDDEAVRSSLVVKLRGLSMSSSCTWLSRRDKIPAKLLDVSCVQVHLVPAASTCRHCPLRQLVDDALTQKMMTKNVIPAATALVKTSVRRRRGLNTGLVQRGNKDIVCCHRCWIPDEVCDISLDISRWWQEDRLASAHIIV